MALFARRVNNFDLYANHAWYVPGVAGMFGLLGWFLLGNLLGSLVTYLLGLFLPSSVVMEYGPLVAYPIAFIPPMMYAAGQSRKNMLFDPGYKLSSANFGPFKWWSIALITLVISFATMISADLPNYLNMKVTDTVPALKKFYDVISALLEQMTGGPFWSSFLLTAIFAPIFEEWLCRGMVLRGLLTKMKPGWAIVISALFFAVIHMNPWQALNAFLIGLVMGYVYYKTGCLWLTMLMHFVNNGFAVICAQIPSLSEYDFWIEMMGRTTYVVIYIAGLAALVLCIMAFKRIPLKAPYGNIDRV